MAIHWIDSGVLIQAEREAYPRSMVPQFWQFIQKQLESGNIRMPRIAYEEITDGGYTDELREWCVNRKSLGLCVSESRAVQERYGEIAAYVQSKYKPHQVREFLDGGDGWVIAHALSADDGVVVTQEIKRPNKSKIKIPTVSKVLDVRCITTFQMLKDLKADFSK